MALKVHIICAKCGSDDVKFKIDIPESKEEREECGCGVYISCCNCAELTSVEEWNEFNKKI